MTVTEKFEPETPSLTYYNQPELFGKQFQPLAILIYSFHFNMYTVIDIQKIFE